ncbi:hydrophobin-251 [Lyophyllum atratum]|nr:hydrophobin-251 [Lyophyllum atratum]
MFSKTALFSVVALALSAVAHDSPTYSCNVGEVQCCNQLSDSQTESGAKLLGDLLGAAAQGVTGQFGVECNPISVWLAINGNSCTPQPVCCDENKINGLVSAACIPANVNV